jgi:hypothetical protein
VGYRRLWILVHRRSVMTEMAIANEALGMWRNWQTRWI